MNAWIEFDEKKRLETLRARGLDMALAGEVFAGPILAIPDDRRDYGEKRCITIGYFDMAMVVIVWTSRNEKIRIISMRKANERERKLYEPRLRPGHRPGPES